MLLENSERIFIFKIPSVGQESAQIVCCHIVYMNVVMFAPVQYSKTLWYFIKKKKKNINVLILIYAHLKQHRFLLSQFVLCCRFLDVGGVCGIKFVNIFFEIFFFSCQESKSFMNEGTWPNTMTSGLDTRERNQQGERGESWRLEALALTSCRWKPNSPATADVWPSPRLSEGEDAETANFRGCHFFQVRWVPRQPNKRRRSCCAECACCCCLSPRRWQAWPRLRYVSLLGGLALA